MFNTHINNEAVKTKEQILITKQTDIIISLLKQRNILVERLIELSKRNFYEDGTQKPFSEKEADLISKEIKNFDNLFGETIINSIKIK